MRYAAAAAALALLAVACGGDDPKPRATPAATQSTTAVSPEGKAVRDAVAKTLAACPCAVEVWAGSNDTGHRVTLRGVYDPKTQSSELKEFADGKDTGIVLRIVDGRAFLDPDLGRWFELDFSGLPKKVVSPLAPLALADPRIAFAFGSSVTVASPSQTNDVGLLHEVEYDMATAKAASGPWSDLLGRLVPEASVYDSLFVKNGGLTRLVIQASGGPADDDSLGVTFTVTKTGVAAPSLAVPEVVRKVDVANEEITP